MSKFIKITDVYGCVMNVNKDMIVKIDKWKDEKSYRIYYVNYSSANYDVISFTEYIRLMEVLND